MITLCCFVLQVVCDKNFTENEMLAETQLFFLGVGICPTINLKLRFTTMQCPVDSIGQMEM